MIAPQVTTRFSLWTNALGWLLGVLLSGPHAFAAEFRGEVVRVLDGDTIEVLHNGKLKVSVLTELTRWNKRTL